jgi:molecular chaperone DnaJ
VLDLVVTRFRRKTPELLGLERGRDLRVQQDVDFTRALLGGEVQVQAAYDTACSTCAGEGTSDPTRNPVCHVCQGQGRLRVGLRRQEMTCGFCVGRGAVLLAPCLSCHGDGKVPHRQQVLVAVPPRTRDGTHLRVRGAGEKATLGGPAGDLVVVVTVKPHPLLRLEGDDLTCTLPLTFAQATGGARVAVPTLEGPEILRILPGTPVGREFRIAGRGAPVAGARPESAKPVRRGDLRIRVTLDVPEHAPAAVVEALRDQEARMGPAGFAQASAFARAVEATRPSAPAPDRSEGSQTPS